MNNQIGSVTSLRGIAALIVVVHHFSYYTLPKLGVSFSARTYFFENGYLCLDLFFILSGFILTHVYLKEFDLEVGKREYWKYLRARFARIYPLHLFTLLLLVGLQIIQLLSHNPTAFTGKFNLTALFANVFLLQAFTLNCPPLFWCNTYWNEPAWSISVEFVIYCIFPFILSSIATFDRYVNSIAYVITLIAILLLVTSTRNNLDNIIGIPSIARCGLECLLGIITYKFYRSNQYRQWFNFERLWFFSIAWIIAIMHNWSEVLRGIHDWAVLPAFSILILSLSTIDRGLIFRLMNSRLLLYLGTISYSIYMVHWVLAEFIKALWRDGYGLTFGSNMSSQQSVIALGVFISSVIAIASLTYQFVEVPMRDRLRYK
jgi:peptidoglycan/LPS O-acetylase OafA/YrhL